MLVLGGAIDIRRNHVATRSVSRVARNSFQLCIDEEALLAELLQARVSRPHHIFRKESSCSSSSGGITVSRCIFPRT